MKFRVVATIVSTGASVGKETVEEFASPEEASIVCEQRSNWECYYYAYPLEDNDKVDRRKT